MSDIIMLILFLFSVPSTSTISQSPKMEKGDIGSSVIDGKYMDDMTGFQKCYLLSILDVSNFLIQHARLPLSVFSLAH